MKRIKNTLINKIIPVSMLVLSLLFIFIYIVVLGIQGIQIEKHNNKIKTTLNESQFNNSYLQIAFEPYSNTADEYEFLCKECKEYIEENNIDTVNVDTSVNVTEDTYIDSNGNSIKSNKDDTMHETGPVFMKDKVLIRYINEKGEMKVVASELVKSPLNAISNQDTFSARTVDTSNLSSLFDIRYAETFDNNIIVEKLSSDDDNNIYINGESYINDISSIFIEILEHSSDDIDNSLKEKALSYFTYDGYLTMLCDMDYIDCTNNNTYVSFIEDGKSDYRLSYNNRIVMQIVTQNNTNKIYTNIVVKLDNNNKVFDIDII